MDFIDELRQFSKRVETMKEKISTEEATKTSLIMPFFQKLGYDVFNPHEFVPEFTADVGLKKGEKVDYAILIDDKPAILVEAKWCGANLEKHDSQLFRYFGTTTAKFAILTNGINYRFYTDIDEQNKMDLTPFLEFNILDVKETHVNELKRFHKDAFNVDALFTAASELKYSTKIIEFMAQQLKNPSDEFTKHILADIYPGVKTQNVINKFRDIVKKSLNQYVSELMNEKITTALKSNDVAPSPAPPESEEIVEVAATEAEPQKKEPTIATTEEELEGLFIVRSMLKDIVPKNKITHKDTQSYFGILYDDNTWKWICRYKLDGGKKYLYLPNEEKKPVAYSIETIDDLYQYQDKIIEAATRYL